MLGNYSDYCQFYCYESLICLVIFTLNIENASLAIARLLLSLPSPLCRYTIKSSSSNNNMTILTYKILQVSGLHVLFRKCGECLSNLVFVIVNKQGKDCFYCEKCKALAESYKITYRLQLVVLDICHDLIDTVIAYDDVCETFIGCPASEFAEVIVAYLSKSRCN